MHTPYATLLLRDGERQRIITLSIVAKHDLGTLYFLSVFLEHTFRYRDTSDSEPLTASSYSFNYSVLPLSQWVSSHSAS